MSNACIFCVLTVATARRAKSLSCSEQGRRRPLGAGVASQVWAAGRAVEMLEILRPFRSPENLMLTVIPDALAGRPVPACQEGANATSWPYVKGHVEVPMPVAERVHAGQRCNIATNCKRANPDVIRPVGHVDLAPSRLPRSSVDEVGSASCRTMMVAS
jgi:hypothetical protein